VALLLKHLNKFYNKKNIPWVNLVWNTYYPNGEMPHVLMDKNSIWWKDLLKLCDRFRGIAKCTMGNGTMVMFLSDVWNDQLLQHKFPKDCTQLQRTRMRKWHNFFRITK
jgi:hypothetical protein